MLHRLLLSLAVAGTCVAGFGAEDAGKIPTLPAKPSGPLIKMWPNGAPGALGHRKQDIPTLEPWVAPADKATGAAFLVCPGGSYAHVVSGTSAARWLNSMGISAFVLTYRVGPDGYHFPAMLDDEKRAMRIIHARAAEWHIDPQKIGVFGSSAGGSLASLLLTHYDHGDPNSTDTVERQDCKPAIGVLLYPVITMGKYAHAKSRANLLGPHPAPGTRKYVSTEDQVTSATPPTFLFQTAADQTVPVQNSLLFAMALADAKVPFELHIYPEGKHGMGIGRHGRLHPYTRALVRWLHDRGFTH